MGQRRPKFKTYERAITELKSSWAAFMELATKHIQYLYAQNDMPDNEAAQKNLALSIYSMWNETRRSAKCSTSAAWNYILPAYEQMVAESARIKAPSWGRTSGIWQTSDISTASRAAHANANPKECSQIPPPVAPDRSPTPTSNTVLPPRQSNSQKPRNSGGAPKYSTKTFPPSQSSPSQAPPQSTSYNVSVDPYKALGVLLTATTHEIEKAYRKKSLARHPDKNHGVTTQAFYELQYPRDLLCDEGERRIYDSSQLMKASKRV